MIFFNPHIEKAMLNNTSGQLQNVTESISKTSVLQEHNMHPHNKNMINIVKVEVVKPAIAFFIPFKNWMVHILSGL